MSSQPERLLVRIPFAPGDDKYIQALAIKLIQKHESDFRPFLDRHIQEDARYTYIEGSLEVTDIEIDSNGGGASITFTSDFYAGCRDQNGTDYHDAFLPFECRDGHMLFDLELPPRWLIQD